jgi:transposase
MKKRKHLSGGNLVMADISKIFKLLAEEHSYSEISRKIGVARSTIRDYRIKADNLSLSYSDLSQLGEIELKNKFKLRGKGRKRKSEGKLDFAYLCKELLKKGVTKLVLYEEYLSRTSEGEAISYSVFCTRVREYKKESKLSMKQVHNPGEKYFVDYSGLTVPIYCKLSHKALFSAEIFLSTLGLSNLTYMEAVASQRTEDFIGASIRSLHFLGGTPQCLVPDNLKAAVTKNNGYEADINRTYQELANYYGVVVLPARSRKPQDKAKVETAVKLVQQRILAPLRNRKFHSLSELNQAIMPLLNEFNQRKMKSYGYSRQELFESIDLPALGKLPSAPYELCIWKKAKVHPDYHIDIDRCYYSVPYKYRGKEVDICIKEKLIEIYDGTLQVAIHKRRRLEGVEDPKAQIRYRYSTVSEHMPPSHEFVNDWTRQGAFRFANSVGTETTQFLKCLFANYQHEQQAIRSTMALPNLEKKYTKDLIEMATAIAVRKEIYSMSYLKETLYQLADQNKKSSDKIEPMPQHENIRGNDYFH